MSQFVGLLFLLSLQAFLWQASTRATIEGRLSGDGKLQSILESEERLETSSQARIQYEKGYSVATRCLLNSAGVYLHSIYPDYDDDSWLVVDTTDSKILSIKNGDVKVVAGSVKGYADGLASSAMFDHPKSAVKDDAGNIYVGDINNNAVRKIRGDNVTTIAGGISAGFVDGVGENAKFSADFDLYIDKKECALLLADRGNNAVRGITLDPSYCKKTSENSGCSSRGIWTGRNWFLVGLATGFIASAPVYIFLLFRRTPPNEPKGLDGQPETDLAGEGRISDEAGQASSTGMLSQAVQAVSSCTLSSLSAFAGFICQPLHVFRQHGSIVLSQPQAPAASKDLPNLIDMDDGSRHVESGAESSLIDQDLSRQTPCSSMPTARSDERFLTFPELIIQEVFPTVNPPDVNSSEDGNCEPPDSNRKDYLMPR